MSKVKKLVIKQNGSTTVLFAFILVALLGIIGVVIDGGLAYATKSKLQKVANSAVLSSVQEIFTDETEITKVVNEILNYHNESDCSCDLTIVPEEKITVVLSKEVSFCFIKLFGINSTTVKASASAGLVSIGSAKGVVPLGIEDSIPLEFYKEYKLKVDQTESDTGCFGILALEGPGAAIYEDNLRYGCSQAINIGDIVETQTGNIAGKTRGVIDERITSCTTPLGDYSAKECTRIMLVPVYRPYDFDSNQLKFVEVVGFAYFYILEPMSKKDTSITGAFIKRAGNGIGDVSSVDRGAYSIRLIK